MCAENVKTLFVFAFSPVFFFPFAFAGTRDATVQWYFVVLSLHLSCGFILLIDEDICACFLGQHKTAVICHRRPALHFQFISCWCKTNSQKNEMKTTNIKDLPKQINDQATSSFCRCTRLKAPRWNLLSLFPGKPRILQNKIQWLWLPQCFSPVFSYSSFSFAAFFCLRPLSVAVVVVVVVVAPARLKAKRLTGGDLFFSP